jgi:hypothetical protein
MTSFRGVTQYNYEMSYRIFGPRCRIKVTSLLEEILPNACKLSVMYLFLKLPKSPFSTT